MRYLRLLSVFYKYSIISELEYRVEFLANVFMSVFWLAWAIVSVAVFFLHSDRIGDWTWQEVLMVVALYTLFSGVMEALLRPNVGAVLDQVRDGTFDFVLTKPVNAQFIASLRNIVVWRLSDVVIGLGLIVYALAQLRITPTLGQLALFFLMLLAATFIVYSLWLMMVSLAFWFVKLDNFTELFNGFYEAGRYPVTIYRGFIRAFLTFVVPIAFVTTFPASALLGRIDQATVLMGIVFAIGLFVVSNRFWNFAVKHYSSASS
ncbi:MAG: ABC-2 family transporter protein [Chloroflexota bacterium]|nr:ABC-2 family transporter protein [Chloroflexota bacterium]